ncbi:hypothetical protein EYZ11_002494 [Aspergillus tanneri]|uniref:Uncharacterized protein n=1 Tax=Aspergillus tanneri TaxID=1220188 RepID=A0A4S3JQP6_9EURO|nr:hypothetical protein EYZ11_002494 [Aspergillus tanneri]
MAAPQPVARPMRHSRGLSLGGRSSHSHHSNNSNKIDLTESAEEKAKRTLHSKADPMVAMNEAQPITVALEKSTLSSLREMQHKDQYGNIITDPDLSNPTRPRLERPLDTIRSFEAAIYGTYSSRPVSYAKTDATAIMESAYYNGRSRPDSFVENNYGGGPPTENYYPYNQGGGRPRRHPRNTSEQAMYGQNYSQNGYAPTGYSQNGYHRSYENETAASGSGSNTDPYGNSTDPSSVNSSIDHLQYQQRMEERAMVDGYGFQGYGSGLNMEGQATRGATGAGKMNVNRGVPVIDPTAGGPVGGPAAAAASNRQHLRKQTNASDASDTKRKSWFKRRFSKN